MRRLRSCAPATHRRARREPASGQQTLAFPPRLRLLFWRIRHERNQACFSRTLNGDGPRFRFRRRLLEQVESRDAERLRDLFERVEAERLRLAVLDIANRGPSNVGQLRECRLTERRFPVLSNLPQLDAEWRHAGS